MCYHCKSWPTNAIVDTPMQELHSRKLRKTLAYEINAQCSHHSMQTRWRGPPRCSCILGDRWIRWFVDLTSSWRFISSWNSPQNVVQGHLVTFGLGEKNKTKQHNCMPSAPASVYGQGQYGNTTNSHTVEFLQSWPTNARVSFEETGKNPSLWNQCTM